MKQGYPIYSKAAQKGEAGIDLVSRIVHMELGWLFKRNHQEHDFGIDAQVDIILDDGSVTGQIIAMQIKYGKSFFQEKNQWGYVYRGEQKHFNYLANYPTPVLIVICHPSSHDCYWVEFDPAVTSRAGENWKITIPFNNILSQSKEKILDLLPLPADYLSEIESYWAINDLIISHQHFLFIIDRKDVGALRVDEPRQFFDRIRSTRELASHCQGKVELSFHGYDDDSRELYEIDEVRRYVPILVSALPELFFFVYTGEYSHSLKTLAMCLSEVKILSKTSKNYGQIHVNFSTDKIAEFLESHFPGINEMTEWLSMPLEENKRISYDVANALGLERQPNDT
ncbi:MAG: DUF4365 domain-containing protein [Candidatus Methylumidiphilus sp.]